jgi:hypothetical protein
MKNITKITLGLALALGLSTLTAVSADPVSRPLDFATQMTPSFPVADYAGVYAGTLHLDIARDGTVSGWYRAQDNGPVQPVAGGHDGNLIWFDIGSTTFAPGADGVSHPSGPLQVTGTLTADRIVGTAQDGLSRLAFTAQQEATSQRSQ